MKFTDEKMECIIEYINTNTEKIAKIVDENFDSIKELTRAKIINELRGFLNPLPVHYEWQYDGCPYDFSGVIVPKGKVSKDLTVWEFLENEFTGDRIASYESGHGFYYWTFGDKLNFLVNEIGYGLLFQIVQRCIEQEFDCSFSDEEFWDIEDECNEFDDIYYRSKISDISDYKSMIEWLGIEERTLESFGCF